MERKTVLATKLAEIITGAIGKNPNCRVLFSQQDTKKVVDFSDGLIVNLDSSEVMEKFSGLLLMSKLVSKDDLRGAARSDLKSWQVDEELIALKDLSPEQTKKVFSLQLSRIVHSLLEWPAINFKVSVGDTTAPARRKKPLHVEEMLLHLYRVAPDPDAISLIEIQKNQLFQIAPTRLPILLTLPLNSQEGYVLSRIKGRLTPVQVADSGPVPAEKIYEILALFQHLGFFDNAPSTGARLVSAGSASAPPPLNPAATAAVPEPAVAGIEVKQFLDEYRALSEELEAKDHYERLGVTREDFSPSQLKTNYYAFAKKYHPDKFRKFGSEQLNEVLEHVLNLLNTAYETLKDPQRRDEYDRELNTGTLKSPNAGPTAQQTRINMDQVANDNFAQGKSLIQVQKYAEAISFLKRAVQIKPENAEYLAYLGYAMARVPQYRRESERHFLRSIELNPMNTNTYLHLGRMYKDVRMFAKALEAFQNALRWDPENRVALQEIDEINAAMGKKSRGFLGNLFKK